MCLIVLRQAALREGPLEAAINNLPTTRHARPSGKWGRPERHEWARADTRRTRQSGTLLTVYALQGDCGIADSERTWSSVDRYYNPATAPFATSAL